MFVIAGVTGRSVAFLSTPTIMSIMLNVKHFAKLSALCDECYALIA